MPSLSSLQYYLPPVAVGGVGGSGTRLVASYLQKLGYFLGEDLNEANDNLWFALLFTRPEILDTTDSEFCELAETFAAGMTGSKPFNRRQRELVNSLAASDRLQHQASWLQERAKTLLAEKSPKHPATLWGWKAPNTHIILDRLINIFDGIKYIHVMRNGLDMAFSSNQNQLKIWGKHFFGEDCEITPLNSLKYWCLTHKRVQAIGQKLGNDFLLLNFDEFCQSPDQGVRELTEFLDMKVDPAEISALTELVNVPDTIGRYKAHGIDCFSDEDLAYVAQLGFETSPG